MVHQDTCICDQFIYDNNVFSCFHGGGGGGGGDGGGGGGGGGGVGWW